MYDLKVGDKVVIVDKPVTHAWNELMDVYCGKVFTVDIVRERTCLLKENGWTWHYAHHIDWEKTKKANIKIQNIE